MTNNHLKYICQSPHKPVLNDTTYSIRPETDDKIPQQLIRSIKKAGIVHPPLLLASSSGQMILSGRRRIRIACDLNLEEIPCTIISKNTPLIIVAECMLTHANTGAELSIIEQAIFFQQLFKDLSKEEKRYLLQLINVENKSNYLEKLSRYLALPEHIVNAIHEGWLQPKNGLIVAKIAGIDKQRSVLEIVSNFKIGGSKQQKLINYYLELAMKDEDKLESIIKRWQQNNRQKENKPQQVTALLSCLKEQCYPRLAKAEKEFKYLRKELQLPTGVTITSSKSFEDESLQLSISFKNKKQLKENWDKIKEIIYSFDKSSK